MAFTAPGVLGGIFNRVLSKEGGSNYERAASGGERRSGGRNQRIISKKWHFTHFKHFFPAYYDSWNGLIPAAAKGRASGLGCRGSGRDVYDGLWDADRIWGICLPGSGHVSAPDAG